MRLRRKIVDLIRLRFLHNADDVGRVGHIAVMQMEGNTLFVRIMDQVVEALGIKDDERRFTPWTTYPLDSRNSAR